MDKFKKNEVLYKLLKSVLVFNQFLLLKSSSNNLSTVLEYFKDLELVNQEYKIKFKSCLLTKFNSVADLDVICNSLLKSSENGLLVFCLSEKLLKKKYEYIKFKKTEAVTVNNQTANDM